MVCTQYTIVAAAVAAPHLANLATASTTTITPIASAAVIGAAEFHGQMAPHYAQFQENVKAPVDRVNESFVPVMAGTSFMFFIVSNQNFTAT